MEKITLIIESIQKYRKCPALCINIGYRFIRLSWRVCIRYSRYKRIDITFKYFTFSVFISAMLQCSITHVFRIYDFIILNTCFLASVYEIESLGIILHFFTNRLCWIVWNIFKQKFDTLGFQRGKFEHLTRFWRIGILNFRTTGRTRMCFIHFA